MALLGKKKKDTPAQPPREAASQNETSYFGKSLKIKGRVTGNGSVIIMGGFEGEFDLRGRLKIAQPANIKGEVRADVISVNGSVQGSLAAQQRLHLDQTARIEGQITTAKLSISEGAFFDGEISMSGQSDRPAKSETAASAPVLQKPRLSESNQK